MNLNLLEMENKLLFVQDCGRIVQKEKRIHTNLLLFNLNHK